MPRLIVVNFHFPPDGSMGGTRWAAFSRHLVNLGWDVRVVAGSDLAQSGSYFGVTVHAVTRAPTLNDVYNRVMSRMRGTGGGKSATPGTGTGGSRKPGFATTIRRELSALMAFPDYSRGWILKATLRLRRLIREGAPDLVVSSGPPHTAHIVAALGTMGSGIPFVCDLRDPWAGQVSSAWLDSGPWTTWVTRTTIPPLEKLIFDEARRLIANTPEAADHTARRYPHQKVVFVPNGFDRSLHDAAAADAAAERGVVYVGTLYGGRSMEPVIEALCAIVGRRPELLQRDVLLTIAGHADGGSLESLGASARGCGLSEHVEHIGVLSRQEALAATRNARVALVLAQDQELQIPGKLYELVGTGCRTLVIAEQGSATANAAARLGVTCVGTDESAGLEEALERALLGRFPAPPQDAVEAVDYARLVVHMAEALGPPA